MSYWSSLGRWCRWPMGWCSPSCVLFLGIWRTDLYSPQQCLKTILNTSVSSQRQSQILTSLNDECYNLAVSIFSFHQQHLAGWHDRVRNKKQEVNFTLSGAHLTICFSFAAFLFTSPSQPSWCLWRPTCRLLFLHWLPYDKSNASAGVFSTVSCDRTSAGLMSTRREHSTLVLLSE